MKSAGNVVLARARRDRHRAVFQRLAEHFQRAAVELGQLVEKQHAVVRQADLARRGRRAAADQAGVADRVVRRAIGPRGQQRLARLAAGPSRCRCASSRSTRRRSGRGRIVGIRLASIVLPEPGGPSISRLWPPAAAMVTARLAISWPRTSAKSTS